MTPVYASGLAIDGGNSSASGSATTSFPIELTTTNSGDVIIVAVDWSNGAPSGPTFSGGGLSWTLRQTEAAGSNYLREYCAIAASPLTAAVLTAGSSSSYFTQIAAFGISGANTVRGCTSALYQNVGAYDNNAGLPGVGSGGGSPSSVSTSTSNPNDMVIGLFATAGGTTSITAGGSFTLIPNMSQTGAIGAEYDIVSSVQSGLGVGFSWSATHAWVSITDAVKAPVSYPPITAVEAISGLGDGGVGVYGAIPVKVGGVRYMAYGGGFGASTGPITISTASTTWQNVSKIATLNFKTADLYAEAFPSLYNNTIYVYGRNAASQGYIAAYNVTAHTWQNVNVTSTGYVTFLLYHSGSFYIVPHPSSGEQNFIYKATPANLFTFASWTTVNMPAWSSANSVEELLLAFDNTYGYVVQNNHGYQVNVSRWDTTANTFTLIKESNSLTVPHNSAQTLNGFAASSGSVTAFMLPNSTNAHWDMWYTTDASTWQELGSIAMINASATREIQGYIYPLNSTIFGVINVQQGALSSTVAIYKSSGTLLTTASGAQTETGNQVIPVVNATSPTLTWAFGSSGDGLLETNLKFMNFGPMAIPTVTQPIKCTPVGSTHDTITFSNGDIGSHSCDGTVVNLTGVTAGATLTITVGAGPSNGEYRFNPSGALTTTLSWTTCSGNTTCSEHDFHDYLLWTNGFDYSVTGGGSPTAPTMMFTSGGNVTTFTLTMSPVSKYTDDTKLVSATDPIAGGAGERWTSGGQTFTPASGGGTDTFAYTHQYTLTMSVSPSNCGTTAPAVGSIFENAGGTVGGISATPVAGCTFTAWTGTGSGSYTGTANPTSVTMSAALTESAGFSGTPQTFCTQAQKIVNNGSTSFSLLISLFFVMAGGTVVTAMLLFTSKDAGIIMPLAFVVLLLGTVIILVAVLFGSVSVANNNTLYGMGCVPQ